jgi:antitoxin component of MazEF toxin-antitoxin module
MITKTLTRTGSSLALVIDKPILELLGIDADTPVSIQTDGTALIIRRAPNANDAVAQDTDFLNAFKRVRERHRELFVRLHRD